MKKLLSIVLVLLSGIIFSQNFGDFKTVTGTATAWTTATNWQRWNGTAWVNQGTAPFGTATYPGEANSSYAVYITTTTMQAPASTAGSFGDVIITGKLNVNVTSVFNTTNIIIDGATALLSMTNNNIDLKIPAGASVILKNGGKLDVGSTCTGNQFLYIGAVKYAQCSGTTPNFTTLNTAGGTLAAQPSATPNPAEPGMTVNLTGLATGLNSTSATYSWTGTGPNGFTFGPNANQSTSFVPQYLGTYTFTLTVTGSNGSTDSQTIFVEVGGCPNFPYEISNSNVATYHAGAARSSTGDWYAWGEDNGGATGVHKVANGTTYYPNVPAGATVKFVSGGSNQQNYNQLVALVDNVYHTDYRIVSLAITSTGVGQVMTPTSLNLPLNSANQQILTKDVYSFYAGNEIIAIVADGRAYVYNNYGVTNTYGDNGATGTAGQLWGKSVKTSAGVEITDFVSVRGDAENHKTAFIGFTRSGKVYAWGTLIPDGTGYGSYNYAVDITPTPATAGAKPVLVGANYNSSNGTVSATFYVLFDNGEMWSIGAGVLHQLGNFDSTNSSSWVRVRTSNSPLVYADVVYFSTEEHDATSDNRASVSMMLKDKQLWAFGSNGNYLLGVGGTNATYDPTIAQYSTDGTPTGPGAKMLGTTNENTALSVEMGGHISFIMRSINGVAQLSIAGHGSSGSLLGNNDSNSYNQYGGHVDVPFPTCYKAPAGCYKSANTTTGTASNVIHGITALQRASKDNADTAQWPLKLKGAYTALDAKTKGFVINRMPSAASTNKGEPVDGTGAAVITSPVKGMAFYDLTNNCLSINTDGTRSGWKCFDKPACDQ